jgi:hypothetical protein
LQSLPPQFNAKVTAIEEKKDVLMMRLDELMVSLQTYEMSLQSQSKSKEKGIALKVKEGSDENIDSDEEISLMTRRVNRMLKKKKTAQ